MPSSARLSDRLRDWALGPGGGKADSRAAAELLGVAARLDGQARQFESHAELAPNEQADRELGRLAADLRGAAVRLRDALAERGLTPTDAVAAAPPTNAGPSGASHWARLVQDLDELRELRGLLVSLTTGLEEADAGLEAPIGDMIGVAEGQLNALRGLIARADPQALD